MKVKIQHILLTLLSFQYSYLFAQNDPCTAANLDGLFGSMTQGCSGGSNASTTVTPGAVNGWSANGGGLTGLVNTCVSGSQDASSQDYWYTFTAASNVGTTNISVANAGGGMSNAEYQLYSSTGTCPNLSMTMISCGTTTGNFTPVAGTTYYIRIYDDNNPTSAMGKFDICPRTTPSNETCTNAIQLTANSTTCGSTMGSLLNGPTSTGSCPADQDVWYKFTTGNPANCYSFVETGITTFGSCTDNLMLIATGCTAGNPSGPLLGYNFTGNAFNDMSTQDLTASLSPNTTYYLQVSSADAQSFCMQYKPNVTSAANDQCSAPNAINVTPTLTDNAVAGCEYSYIAAQDANITAASICAGTRENISWYQFVALNTGSPIVITFANITCNNGGGGFQSGLFSGSSCASLTVGLTGAPICAAGASGTLTYTIPAGSVVAGNSYLIAMDGNAGSNCHFAVSGTNLAPLPIELMNFYVSSASIKQVDLMWSTASEHNNEYFTVEKSIDGENFHSIGTVIGAINSIEQTDYRFSDNTPSYGISYYRLKQTDTDGKQTYSEITSVTIDEFEDFNFKVFPNPAGADESLFIQFSSKKSDLVNVEVYDFKGMLIFSNQVVLNNDITTIQVNQKFKSGVYFIRGLNSKGEILTRKFTIQ